MEDCIDELISLLKQVDFDLNMEEREIEGRSKITVHQDYGSLPFCLYEIEQMVREIEKTEELGFFIGWGWQGLTSVQPLTLATKYYERMRSFLKGHSCSTVYTLRVKAFYDACKALGMLDGKFMPGEPWQVHADSGRVHADLFNAMIEKVREKCRSSAFKARLRSRETNAKRNEAKGLALEAQMFRWKSRHLILSLHLGYHQQYRKSITLEEIQRHREGFFRNRRMNGLLKGIKGFVWKIEEGEDTGLHLHVLLFYTASSRADVHIAQLIGEYWVNVITRGKGSYWNSNAQKWKHKLFGHGIGTGMIDRTDTAKREALRENIRYLAKSAQHLMMKYGDHTRTSGTSHVPEKIKPGRPRID